MARAYYNENDPYAAAWLENLIAAGAIAPGDVDTRDIQDIRPADLDGYTQCHFFAGIGVWSRALREAGWPDDRPVWTGSCPCQPFSAAGKGDGFDDERHLWPGWQWLIEQCRPETVFGEQVASADGLDWADLVQADMEAAGYAVGFVDTCAASFRSFHIRQRLYFAAQDLRSPASRLVDGKFARLEGYRWNGHPGCQPGRLDTLPHRSIAEAGASGGVDNTTSARSKPARQRSESEAWHETRLCGSECGCCSCRVGNACRSTSERHAGELSSEKKSSTEQGRPDGRHDHGHTDAGASGGVAYRTGDRRRKEREDGRRCEPRDPTQRRSTGSISSRQLGGVADDTDSGCNSGPRLRDEEPGRRRGVSADENGLERLADPNGGNACPKRQQCSGQQRQFTSDRCSGDGDIWADPFDGYWRDADWLFCRDDKWRPVEPGTFPLAHEAPARMGRLRAYGNGLDLAQASGFIRAYLERDMGRQDAVAADLFEWGV